MSGKLFLWLLLLLLSPYSCSLNILVLQDEWEAVLVAADAAAVTLQLLSQLGRG